MTFDQIYAAALRYLAMREHSQWQLQQKLQRKFPEQTELIRSVLDQLHEDNAQSEARFADTYVRSRAHKGYGPVKIRYELQQRGISTDLIEAALWHQDLDWLALQEKTRQKKFGADPMPKEFTMKAKQLHYLHQRGFT
jgi:regulatory protein